MSINSFFPESEIIYLLMEYFSSKGSYIPKYISAKYNKIYISNNSRTQALKCSEITWKTRITKLFPLYKQHIVRNSLSRRQKHYDLELSYDKNHDVRRKNSGA